MADSFFGGQSPVIYIIKILYCILPAIAMLIGVGMVPNPWIALIGIHLVIMLLLPYILHKIWGNHVSFIDPSSFIPITCTATEEMILEDF